MHSNKQAVVLLDGGMGQELLRRSGRKPTPMWSAQVMKDEPEIVRDLHIDFIKAGAKVITINSYSATPERLAREGHESLFEDLQAAALDAAEAARDMAGVENIKIAGCLPPLFASYRPDIAPEFDVMAATYERIVNVQKGKVDLIMCETMASLAEARAATIAAKSAGLPVWVGLTVEDDESGRLRSGEPLEQAVTLIDEIGVDAKLINCSQPESITASWSKLSAGHGLTGAYANGFTSISGLQPGGTVETLAARQDLSPTAYADFVMSWVEAGAAIVGGCCEVGPAHIAEIARRLEKS